ncbi:shufflon protein C' [Salmonella enterica subsp. enterica serovar Worthington]|nr:shufflon protein C' [Salmonella enterica subsp. enterica serovar Worthington]
MNHFIGGKSGGSIYYKPIQCPTGYIMTGTRMYGIGTKVLPLYYRGLQGR